MLSTIGLPSVCTGRFMFDLPFNESPKSSFTDMRELLRTHLDTAKHHRIVQLLCHTVSTQSEAEEVLKEFGFKLACESHNYKYPDTSQYLRLWVRDLNDWVVGAKNETPKFTVTTPVPPRPVPPAPRPRPQADHFLNAALQLYNIEARLITANSLRGTVGYQGRRRIDGHFAAVAPANVWFRTSALNAITLGEISRTPDSWFSRQTVRVLFRNGGQAPHPVQCLRFGPRGGDLRRNDPDDIIAFQLVYNTQRTTNP